MKKKLAFLIVGIVSMSLIACSGESKTTKSDSETVEATRIDEAEEVYNATNEETVSEGVENTNITDDIIESNDTTTTEESSELVDGMRPEFKEAMDSYEVFFDEYCEFMKKYTESDDTLAMLADYIDYMEKYTDAMEKIDAIGDEDLNQAELKYYTEVMGRINEKLINVTVE